PRVIALTAGPKTATAMPISAFETATMRKAWVSVTAIAARPTAAAAATMAARFQRVASMKAPAGVWAASVARPMMVMTTPMLSASQCGLVSRKTARSEPVAHIGEEEIEPVDRRASVHPRDGRILHRAVNTPAAEMVPLLPATGRHLARTANVR